MPPPGPSNLDAAEAGVTTESTTNKPPAAAPPAPQSRGIGLWMRRAGGGGGGGAAAAAAAPATPPASSSSPSLLARLAAAARRPDVITAKTLPPKWRALRSRWRYVHAATFYLGWPAYLLRRVWPPLLLNMLLALAIAADHISRALARRPLLPDLNPDVIKSLDPLTRYLMFSITVVLAIRLNRTYERWFAARQGFAGVGSTVLALAQRFEALSSPARGDPSRDALMADVVRWGVVWHHSVLQIVMGRKEIASWGAAFLHADELAAYRAARKGRQFAVLKLSQLVASFDGGGHSGRLVLDALLRRGVQMQGTCTTIRLQAMPYALTLLSTGFVEVFLLMLPLASLGAAQQRTALVATGPGGGGGAAAAASSTTPMTMMPSGEPPHQSDEAVFTALIVVLIYVFINLLFLGADEVASQLENPFDWFPCDDIVCSTARDSVRMLREAEVLRAMVPGGAALGQAPEDATRREAGGMQGKVIVAPGTVRGPPRPLDELAPPG
jgi:predicted membrane chloride channel (bestrophin family)